MNFPRFWNCQQDAAKPEHCRDERGVGELADEKATAADMEIVSQFTEVSIADNSGQRWNDADDGVGCELPQLAKQNRQAQLEDRDHQAEIGQPTEVWAAHDTGEDGWAVEKQVHNVWRPLR